MADRPQGVEGAHDRLLARGLHLDADRVHGHVDGTVPQPEQHGADQRDRERGAHREDRHGRDEQRQSGERARILVLLEARNEPMAPREVAEALGVSQTNVRMTMSRMTKDRELLKDGYGLYRIPRTLSKEQSEAVDKLSEVMNGNPRARLFA